jgi:hypothetical protein
MRMWSSTTIIEPSAPALRRRQGNPENGARLRRDLDAAGGRARAARVAAPKAWPSWLTKSMGLK